MIGLLPAAGQATRMNGLPKYLLPVGDNYLLAHHHTRMLAAGCRLVLVGSNQESYSLIAPFTGHYSLIYIAKHHSTMSETILSLNDEYFSDAVMASSCLFGMPDTYFEDAYAYHKLADALNAGAQVAVGLFRARPGQHTKVGMVYMDGEQISDVIDKPVHLGRLEWFWGVLAWQPAFWDCIKPQDPHIGYAIPRAITFGLDVRAVFMDGRYWDAGTPEEYFECIRAITSEA